MAKQKWVLIDSYDEVKKREGGHITMKKEEKEIDYTFVKHLDSDIETFRTDAKFQRIITKDRLNNIKKSILSNGFGEFGRITINTDYQIIDGQHRFVCAKELGYKELPATMYSFATKEDEVKFFIMINNFNTTIAQKQFVWSQYYAGEPAAVLLYELENCKDSLFYKNIYLKNKGGGAIKFSINSVYYIIYAAVFGKVYKRNKKDYSRIMQRITSVDMDVIIKETNEFIEFINRCFGSKTRKGFAFIDGLCVFYIMLRRKGLLVEGYKKEQTINKIMSIEHSPYLLKGNREVVIRTLIEHFKKGRKNRLDYFAFRK